MADRIDAILVKLGQPSGPAPLKRWLETLSARDGAKPPVADADGRERSEHRRRSREPGPRARGGRARRPSRRIAAPGVDTRPLAPPTRVEATAHNAPTRAIAARRHRSPSARALHAVGAAHDDQRGPDPRGPRRRVLLRPASPAGLGHAADRQPAATPARAARIGARPALTGTTAGRQCCAPAGSSRSMRAASRSRGTGRRRAGHVHDLRAGQPIVPAAALRPEDPEEPEVAGERGHEVAEQTHQRAAEPDRPASLGHDLHAQQPFPRRLAEHGPERDEVDRHHERGAGEHQRPEVDGRREPVQRVGRPREDPRGACAGTRRGSRRPPRTPPVRLTRPARALIAIAAGTAASRARPACRRAPSPRADRSSPTPPGPRSARRSPS